jgi:molybdopterin-guanine dinucleotide biosynthesis protein
VRETKLVLIDGLPGSGKTTTALALVGQLQQRGVAAQCVLESAEEGRDQPLNVGGPLHPAGNTTGAQLFAHYTVESYIEESLYRWQAFVDLTARAGIVQVVESYPYQNAARILLQMDASMEQIAEYVATIEQTMRPLRPVMVYFERRNVEEALRAAAALRGPEWTAYAIEVITACSYAKRRGLYGLEGAHAMLVVYKAMMDELLARSQLPVLVLADCFGRWEMCHRQILEFLEVPG